jgi:hypothetical protein
VLAKKSEGFITKAMGLKRLDLVAGLDGLKKKKIVLLNDFRAGIPKRK